MRLRRPRPSRAPRARSRAARDHPGEGEPGRVAVGHRRDDQRQVAVGHSLRGADDALLGRDRAAEGVGRAAELIGSHHVNMLVDVTVGEPVRRLQQLPGAAHDLAREQHCGERGQHDRAHPQPEHQRSGCPRRRPRLLREVLLLGLQRALVEVELLDQLVVRLLALRAQQLLGLGRTPGADVRPLWCPPGRCAAARPPRRRTPSGRPTSARAAAGSASPGRARRGRRRIRPARRVRSARTRSATSALPRRPYERRRPRSAAASATGRWQPTCPSSVRSTTTRRRRSARSSPRHSRSPRPASRQATQQHASAHTPPDRGGTVIGRSRAGLSAARRGRGCAAR